MRPGFSRLLFFCLLATIACTSAVVANEKQDTEGLRILFLGDQGHHRPAERFAQLQPVMERRGIELVYTERVADLNLDRLNEFDGLLVYANIDRIEPEQESALLEYVASGHGFIPLHCASFCFLNSDKYVELVGAQFQRHGTGVFRTQIDQSEHPVMSGFGGFSSWDETYVHHRHNEGDRTVLSYRIDSEGREPWTWVRTHGDGRVFYTAWGHDDRTWGHDGFQNLVERGIRWAVGDDDTDVPDFTDPDLFPIPKMQEPRTDVEPFEYEEAEVPFYPPSQQWGVLGDAFKKMQQPLEAAESMKHIVVPEGFEVQLFASDPDIKKPICMNWDHRGRLWIAETIDYPNEIKPSGEGRDQIKICEDTDGDGTADKFTVFAEGLSIPTSLVFYDGGVIVHQAPETLFLKDTDGDDVADVRRVLFRGWSTGDTHAGPSNLHYGLDNWIWGIVGYAGFDGEIGGERQSFRTGFYRFAGDGSQMEFLRNTNNNSWGVGFNEEGVLFGSTANRNPSVYMPIANRYYENVRGWSSSVLGSIADNHLFDPITERVRQVDQHGGYTAAAGHALYTARAWPKEYWNRTAFVTGSTGHLIGVFHLKSMGSDFESTSPFNILASDDEWTAPIMAEVGPDGQLWVIDWYNYIVQHNPTPSGYRTGKGNAYETDLRDKRHGRIYRVVYNDSPAEVAVDLSNAEPEELVAALKHSNLLWRRHAQRLLVERGAKDVVPKLIDLVNDPSTDELGLNVGAIHALWTLHGLGALTEDSVATESARLALKHASAGVRRNALQVLPSSARSIAAILESGVVSDADAQVRLAALLALADQPSDPSVANVVVEALLSGENVNDRWLPDAATAAAANQENSFLSQALRQEDATPALLATARIVAEHVMRSNDPSRLDGLIVSMSEGNRQVAASILDGLTNGWSDARPVKILDADEEAMIGLVQTLDAGSRGQLILLAGRMGSEQLETYAREVSEALLAAVEDEDADDADRLDAVARLIEFRGKDVEAMGSVLDVITPRASPELAAGLINAVRQSSADEVGGQLIQRLANWTPNSKTSAIRALLGRPTWTADLLTALEDGGLQLSDLALDQKQALLSHPNEEIASRMNAILESGGVNLNADRVKVLEQMMPVIHEPGDVAQGAAMFEKHCAKCHVYQGKGTSIGPDLSGMAVHPKEELLTQILDPSRSVEGNYQRYTVVTLDGLVINGLLASETRTSVELFDTDGKKQVVLREDIDELIASPKSLMPEGFEEQMMPEELSDLLAFLTQRGQYVPIPIDKVSTIVSTKGMFFTEESTVERLVFPDWSPKEFNGIPFVLVDPQGDRVPNVIMLNGPNGNFAPRMPKQVSLPVNGSARAIHLLSGVSGWGSKQPRENGPVSMIVRVHYEDGETEDHPLLDGYHFADYIGHFDVPGSELAFKLRAQQIRFLTVRPKKTDSIEKIDFVKGEDRSAPIVMAVTLETLDE